jgi:hypothetical protein
MNSTVTKHIKTNKTAFYFANLGADVMRCALALERSQEAEYESSLARAQSTLRHLAREDRPEAYEEGPLLLRGLVYARASGSLAAFREMLNCLVEPFASRIGFS